MGEDITSYMAELDIENNFFISDSIASITNEVLDVEVLKAFETIKSDDGLDFVIELIDLYLHGTPQRIQAIRKAVAEKEWIALKNATHTLKGSSSTLGVRTVAKVCEELENVTPSTSNEVVQDLLQKLESQLLRAREVLIAERNRRLQPRQLCITAACSKNGAASSNT
jgi:HPt (histidine-containing phosphotransfer) domain-containing protein